MKLLKKPLQVVLAWLVAIPCALAAVNINTATVSELDTLPGVGPVKAQAIVDDRSKNGPFKTPADIKRVNGIGAATFEQLKNEITVSGANKGVKAAAPTAATARETAKPAAKVVKAGKEKSRN